MFIQVSTRFVSQTTEESYSWYDCFGHLSQYFAGYLRLIGFASPLTTKTQRSIIPSFGDIMILNFYVSFLSKEDIVIRNHLRITIDFHIISISITKRYTTIIKIEIQIYPQALSFLFLYCFPIKCFCLTIAIFFRHQTLQQGILEPVSWFVFSSPAVTIERISYSRKMVGYLSHFIDILPKSWFIFCCNITSYKGIHIHKIKTANKKKSPNYASVQIALVRATSTTSNSRNVIIKSVSQINAKMSLFLCNHIAHQVKMINIRFFLVQIP